MVKSKFLYNICIVLLFSCFVINAAGLNGENGAACQRMPRQKVFSDNSSSSLAHVGWSLKFGGLSNSGCSKSSRDHILITQLHEVTNKVRWFFDSRYIHASSSAVYLVGNRYQQMLMMQCFSIANACSDMREAVQGDKRFDLLQDAIVDVTNASVGFNLLKQEEKAARAVDAAQSLLACLQAGLEIAKTVGVRVVVPAAKGVAQGVHNTADMILHPIKAAQQFVDSVVACSKTVGLLCIEMRRVKLLIELSKHTDHYPVAECENLRRIHENAGRAVEQAVCSLTLEKAVEHAATFGTEVLCFHGIGKFCGFVSKNIAAIISDALESINLREVAMTTDGIAVPVTNNFLTEKMSSEAILGNSNRVAAGVFSVQNIHEFFKNFEFGKILKRYSKKTNRRYQGCAIYEITQDIVGTDLEKGFCFYLDMLHKDHLKVFSGSGKCETVLNLDGSVNIKKMKKSLLEARRLKV